MSNQNIDVSALEQRHFAALNNSAETCNPNYSREIAELPAILRAQEAEIVELTKCNDAQRAQLSDYMAMEAEIARLRAAMPQPPAAPLNFVKGGVYQHPQFGTVEYRGLDNCAGQITHEFFSPQYSRYVYVQPIDLATTFATAPARPQAPAVGDDEQHLHMHPRAPGERRDEIELFLRDAYAAGCNAVASRSLMVAMDYARIHAPKMREALAATTKDRSHE